MFSSSLYPSDQDLLKKLKAGDESVLEIIVKKHQEKVYSTILFLVKHRDLADDILQDTFIKVINNLRQGKYNEEGKLSQWMARVAYNMCIDHFRRVKRKPSMTEADATEVIDYKVANNTNAEQSMIRDQTCDAIREVIDRLPAEQREVVILRHYGDMSFKEIAEMTGVSINTALGRMRYALGNMKKLMANSEVAIR